MLSWTGMDFKHVLTCFCESETKSVDDPFEINIVIHHKLLWDQNEAFSLSLSLSFSCMPKPLWRKVALSSQVLRLNVVFTFLTGLCLCPLSNHALHICTSSYFETIGTTHWSDTNRNRPLMVGFICISLPCYRNPFLEAPQKFAAYQKDFRNPFLSFDTELSYGLSLK